MRKSIIDRLLVPTAVSLTTVVFALIILQRLLLQQQAQIQESTKEQTLFVKNKIESELDSHFLPLELLRERWSAASEPDFAHMESDTQLAMSGYPGYQAIVWIDPRFHKRWSVPQDAASEADIAADDSPDLARLAALQSAPDSDGVIVTRSVNLQQGGRGLLVWAPVFRNGKFSGYILGVYRVQALLDSILGDVGPGYSVTVSDGDAQIYGRQAAAPPAREEPAQNATVHFQELTWAVHVWPISGKTDGQSVLPQVTFVGGLVLAAWLAVTAYMAEAAKLRAKELATANKELTKEIAGREKAEEALREAQKMEAVGRLAGGVAHDFNNMLMVIRSQAEVSLNGLPPGDSLRAELDEIVRTSDRASSLTRQLLAFGRKQMLKPQVLNLNTLVAQVAALLPPVLGVDIQLKLELEQDLDSIKADSSQLEQVMMNLVFNARDAMPNGGQLTIRTENAFLDEAWVAGHAGMRAGPHVMLGVNDTGCGMDHELLAHIFEPFFTTKDRTKGTGLGLASVYGTVHQSGGYIAVSSKIHEGTQVQIYFERAEGVVEVEVPQERAPSISGHEAMSAQETMPGDDTTSGHETILVVEDDDAVRRMTKELLSIKGYQVAEARSAKEAIEFMERHGDTIDLVLTDLTMPGMKGQELGEELAKLHADVRLLYMSAYTEDALQTSGTLTAGTAFIEKPFSIDELAQKVREVLGTKSNGNGNGSGEGIRSRSASGAV
jgi:signal transduction histidine kinase/CheY-like chemotaxis protein